MKSFFNKSNILPNKLRYFWKYKITINHEILNHCYKDVMTRFKPYIK